MVAGKHQFLTKQEGVKKKDRKDAKLQNVIINEKRIKKVSKQHHSPPSSRRRSTNEKQNAKYLATQLPHPYESAVQ